MNQILSLIPSDAEVLVDEAYIEYAITEDEGSLAQEVGRMPNVIVVRTFSKYFGLAGVRAGYAVLSKEKYRVLRPFFQPWNVNAAAEIEAESCLDQLHFYEEQKQKMVRTREEIRNILQQRGFHVLPSEANFLCATHQLIEKYKARWRREGIQVNELLAYRNTYIENYVRISIQTDDIMQFFMSALPKRSEHP